MCEELEVLVWSVCTFACACTEYSLQTNYTDRVAFFHFLHFRRAVARRAARVQHRCAVSLGVETVLAVVLYVLAPIQLGRCCYIERKRFNESHLS